MTNLFNSVYSGTTTTISPGTLALSFLISILLGFALAWMYRYKTLYTKEFVITLVILPTIIGMIIFLVNDNLGTGVAVAGTFSFVRFRSAAGGSRELLSLFLSMVIGLCTGTGYLALAIVTTLVFLLLWFILEKMTFFSSRQTGRSLVIDLPKERNEEKRIRVILREFCNNEELMSVKSTGSGDKLKLTYQIDLKSDDDDIALTNELLSSLDSADINMSKVAKKKKNL